MMGKGISGLTSHEANKQLVKFGRNKLPEKPPPSSITIFISQLKSPLVYILIAAGTVTFSLGDYPDTLIIVFAILLNTILGFIQERKASNALAALKKMLHPHTKVIRNGKDVQIETEEVVPGDICILHQGDKVPADGTVIEAQRLFVSEAVLTGESVPVEKKEKNEVFMGTVVTGGNALIRVEKTGSETQMGSIALSVQEEEEDTPLKRQVKVFSKQLTYLTLGLTFFVFAIGMLTGRPLIEMFETSVALAVSAIPEGLLVGLTVVLAVGMQRILARKGLVRNLVSAETLGGVTTICMDKTGTLTEGNMKVVGIEGDEKELALQSIVANDLDDPLVIAAYSWAQNKVSDKKILSTYKRMDTFPFSSKDRFFAIITSWNKNKNMLFVNGAPEYLLKWSNLDSDKKKEIRKTIDELSREGKRIIAMARKEVAKSSKSVTKDDVRNGLEWIGLISFSDPVRNGIKDSFAKAIAAGVRPIVITGDYAPTAVAVMNQIGINTDEINILSGKEVSELSEAALRKVIKDKEKVMLYARTTPKQKLKIVRALKSNGEVVAMMGDGVNDAPALKHADIGIVVGNATDVAKESADLVLMDSSFETIIATVEEGRGIFENIRKIILYLMSDAFEEIVAVVGALILGLPLPVTAAQILWINLISDGFPNLALTVDPKRVGIMKEPPRDPKEPIVANWIKLLIAIVSLGGGLVALYLFKYTLNHGYSEEIARSVAFAALGVNSLFYVFSIRTLKDSFWEENPLSNKYLNWAVLGGIVFQVLPFVLPVLGGFLDVKAIPYNLWLMVFGASAIMFIIIEAVKDVASRVIK